MLLEAIDEALKKKITNAIFIPADPNDKTKVAPVPVVISTPDRFTDPTTWPIITIWMYDSDPDYVRQSVQSELGNVSLSKDKKVATIRTPAQAIDAFYQIDSFALYAEHDRIIQKAMWALFPARTKLIVLDEDNLIDGHPTPNMLWMLFDGYKAADIMQGETRMFHKVWSWKLPTALDIGATEQVPTAWRGVKLGNPLDTTATSVGLNLLD
jgi:hypothetical protein